MKHVKLETDLGNIVLQLNEERATRSVNYFCDLVTSGAFRKCHFYRVVRKNPLANTPPSIDIIQGGVGWEKCDALPDVVLETTRETGLTHKDGTISLARSKADVSASEFFICVGDQPKLDYGGTEGTGIDGFAAFGQVLSGMNIVRAIHQSPANGLPPGGEAQFSNEFLDNPIEIIATLIDD